MIDGIDDTIVAVSSAPGVGRVGIVRLSGPQSLDIGDRLAALAGGRLLSDCPGSTRTSGTIQTDRDAQLPAAFLIFRAPHSYTRQDMIEIQTVGSPAAMEVVRRRAIDLGARAAKPGEFTARAFVHGAMDLASAEAVAGVVRAESDTQLRAARRMMDGSLARHVTEVRNHLAELLALVEADIDFAEEPIEFITPNVLQARLASLAGGLDSLLAGSVSVERFDTLPRILLFGRPNAGKSSLMNCLSGTARSICAAVAGTTRDILSAPIRLGRGEAILLDTAGVDETHDAILAQARSIVLSEAERVDLVCVVIDLTDPDLECVRDLVRLLNAPRFVIAANKVDAIGRECDMENAEWGNRTATSKCRIVESLREWGVGPVCVISAMNGTGLDELRSVFETCLGDQTTSTLGESLLVSERQRSALIDASESVDRAIALAEGAGQTADLADLIAFELREALERLGAITGEVTVEDLLGQVFSRFCIGK
jgi:tRNA modification GTPase